MMIHNTEFIPDFLANTITEGREEYCIDLALSAIDWVNGMVRSGLSPPLTEATAIAGGYVRDLILERPISDIDVYVKNGKGVSTKHLPDSNFYQKKLTTSAYRLKFIEEIWENRAVPVQIMLINKPPKEVVENDFDYGICQAMIDWANGVRVSEYFKIDRNRKCLTMLPREEHSPFQLYKTMWERRNKLQIKYPGFTPSISLDILEDFTKLKEL